MSSIRTTNELLSIALYATILVIVITPLYIYGISKWHQFQRHFIVSKRFPLITNLIVTSSICSMTVVLIRRWVEYFDPEFDTNNDNIIWAIFIRLAQALAYLTNMLAVHRVLLVYLRWKNVQHDIQQIMSKPTDSTNGELPDSAVAGIDMKSVTNSSVITINTNTMSTTMSKQISTDSINGMMMNSSRDHAFSLSEFEMKMGENEVNFIKEHNENVYKHKASVIFMILTIIGSIWIILYYTIIEDILSGFGQVTWFIPIITGLIVIILIKCKNVTEGIGVLKEAYILLGFIVITLGTTPVLSHDSNLFLIIVSTYPLFPGLLTLYITLYYIHKCEGTLNSTTWKKKYKTQIFNDSVINRKQSDFAIILTDETSTGPKDDGDENRKNNKSSSEQENREKEVADMPLSCLTYLEQGENHKIFAEYLAYCFALENILFMERVSVLYQIVLDLKEKNGESRNRTLSLSPGYSSNNSFNRDRQRQRTPTPTPTKPSSPSPKLQRNKFEHSVQVYFDFHKKIDRFNEKYRASGEMRGNIGTIGYYLKILYKLHRDIYKEFVKTGSKYEINISSEIRNELSFLFDDNRNIHKFASFDDFLHLFDNALIQVYEMLFSVYNYQFKKYLKTQNLIE